MSTNGLPVYGVSRVESVGVIIGGLLNFRLEDGENFCMKRAEALAAIGTRPAKGVSVKYLKDGKKLIEVEFGV